MYSSPRLGLSISDIWNDLTGSGSSGGGYTPGLPPKPVKPTGLPTGITLKPHAGTTPATPGTPPYSSSPPASTAGGGGTTTGLGISPLVMLAIAGGAVFFLSRR